jgi:hypothetical protein
MQFSTKNGNIMDMSITHNNSQIASISDIKFLGLMTDSTLSWKGHIEWLMSGLSSAIYAVRAIKVYSSLESMSVFMKLKILPLCSQYIFSLLLFVAKNKDLFLFNPEIHVINTKT